MSPVSGRAEHGRVKPAHYHDERTFIVTSKKISLALDPAATDKTTSDYSAMVALYWESDSPATRQG
jgi:hypothetical protein